MELIAPRVGRSSGYCRRTVKKTHAVQYDADIILQYHLYRHEKRVEAVDLSVKQLAVQDRILCVYTNPAPSQV